MKENQVTILLDFLNTIDVSASRRDALRDPAEVSVWLSEHGTGLAGPAVPPSLQDVALAVEVREALRDLAREKAEPPASAASWEVLNRAASMLGVRLGFGMETRGSESYGLNHVVSQVLVAAHTGISDGTWKRIGICRNPDCRWAFYDRSKSRTRLWCSMKACGNRMKARRYRQKRASPQGTG